MLMNRVNHIVSYVSDNTYTRGLKLGFLLKFVLWIDLNKLLVFNSKLFGYLVEPNK